MPYLAQVRLLGDSGLDEDVYTNTFHFTTVGGADVAGAEDVADAVAAFYNTTATGATGAVSRFIGHQVSRSVAGEIRVYDSAVDPMGPPLFTDPFTLGAAASTNALPEEVAGVLSFYHGDNSPNAIGRGRIYLGPLETATSFIDSDGHVRLTSVFRTDVVAAATALRDQTITDANTRWAVRYKSAPTTISWSPVDHGFVDNAFDTQRRRGVAATLRSTF